MMIRWAIGFSLWATLLPLVGCTTGAAGDRSDAGNSSNQGDQEAGAQLPDPSDSGTSDDGPATDSMPGGPDEVTTDGTPDEDFPVTPGDPPDSDPIPPDDSPDREPAVWSLAFDASSTGALSAVWGSADDDVFVVGGTPQQGEIYHYDGTAWRAMQVPSVPLLVWVYGFGPDDVYAVGVGGGAVHYDGQTWTAMTSGTTEDLWGVWGRASNDLWIVGGNVGQGEPVILHYDGQAFTPIPIPVNDRGARSLFKVWGIGSKVFAVGELGLIIQYENGQWFQVPAGANADDDFVSLWGTSEDNIVAVGGRAGARIAVYDGSSWTTSKPTGIPGLNAICTREPDVVVVGGVGGYVGSYNPFTDTLTTESADTQLAVHGAWVDPTGRFYAVGGRFGEPYTGVALMRTLGDPGIIPQPPLDVPPECVVDTDCPVGRVCDGGQCIIAPGCAGGDVDSDGWLNSCDNCVSVANPLQADGDFDGVGDLCDDCSGFDDNDDADDDSVPDGCDVCPGSNDTIDTDSDGVPNACDLCSGFDDNVDTDADGVADGCDLCPGGDDAADDDGDGVPDDCDLCPGANDNLDADTDGVPNVCDLCPGFDDGADADSDGVPDGCDACPGFDDGADADTDGVPDDCDVCPDADDNLDSDADGVPNACDICPGFDDGADSDNDGIPNGCDECDGDDLQDADADGVPDACDVCPGFDDSADADSDGIPDDCDICPGFDDLADADGDAVPDGCDICANFDDHSDIDSDGVPDGCDVCPLDNPDDADSDGVCDSDDICPGFDDSADSDTDGVPDGCDICSGFDDAADADADGVPNGCDICAGFDDGVDTDADSVPDGCDVCAGFDDGVDSDTDSVPDGCDICPGFDDNVDSDSNGIPDGCCAAEPDCLLGEACMSGFCQPVTVDIELGPGGPLVQIHVKIPEGGNLPIYRGFQGGGDLYLSYQTLGYTPNGSATVTLLITMVDDGADVPGTGFSPSGIPFTETPPGSGINQQLSHYLIIFVDPCTLFDRQATVTLTITDDAETNNEPIKTTIQQTVVIVNASESCSSGTP